MNIVKRIIKKVKRSIINDPVEALAKEVRQEKLTYLSFKALQLLGNSVKKIEKNNLEGIIIETGCALGGSSILIGKIKSKDRVFKVYDSFEMMPEPSERDGKDVHERYEVIQKGSSKGIQGDLYYGYEKDLYNKVKNSFEDFNVDMKNISLIKGYYEDTLFVNEKVALAHIDCDWYDSVIISLERIEPHLVKEGMLIIDDYYRYSGCKKAVDDYFKNKMNDYSFIKEERLLIKKNK